MPIPQPTPNEEKSDFIARCMSDDKMISEYPEASQRLAICQTSFKSKTEAK
jgi:hypothetical protein